MPECLTPMKILFATDGSDASSAAEQLLLALPLEEATEIKAVHIITEPVVVAAPNVNGVFANVDALGEIRQAEEAYGEETLRRAAERLGAGGRKVSTELRDGDPAREIIAAADEMNADLVVVGSKGLTGLDALLLGSVARNVAKHCRRPVVVARRPRAGLSSVVVATDGSEHAAHAVRFAASLALPVATRFTAVNVVRPYTPFQGLAPADEGQFDAAILEVRQQHRELADHLAREAAKILLESGHAADVVAREGDPATEIMAVAQELSADLIVAGARGVSLIQGLFVGSVADRLVREAHCSVLLVH